MTAVTINGNTYSDDGSSARDMDNGGFRTWLLPMIGDAATVSGNSDTSATASAASAAAALVSQNAAASSAANALTSENNAAANAAGFTATSTTSLALATGTKVFTIQTGKQFTAGNQVKIVSAADNNNYFYGTVVSYVGTTLTTTITEIGGSGTYADWTIALSGVKGATGSAGSVGTLQTAADFAQDTGTTSALNYGYKAGFIRSNNNPTSISASTVALTDNTTNYVEVDTSGVSANTVGFTGGKFPMATVVTSAGAITTVTDKRSFATVSAPTTMARVTKTADYTLVADDLGKTIELIGATSSTFTTLPAATAGAGWYCTVKNSCDDTAASTDPVKLTIDGNASETIDGVATVTEYMGGALRLVTDGSNWFTIRVSGGFARFVQTGSFIEPTKLTQKPVVAYGGGGGGGRAGAASGTSGGGGGGGACRKGVFTAFATNTSTTVTVGAGGTGATTTATDGVTGGQSVFATLKAGGGYKGSATSNVAGGGGGTDTATSSSGGLPNITTGSAIVLGTAGGDYRNNVGFGGAGAGSTGLDSGCAEFGGGGGGYGTSTGNGRAGGSSIEAGGGGGGGTQTASSGGAGGAHNSTTVGGGGAGGSTGVAGTAGTSRDYAAGDGGGGGGSNGTTGTAGGNGGLPAGGGGGGGGGSTTGNGGNGGRGEVRVWYS